MQLCLYIQLRMKSRGHASPIEIYLSERSITMPETYVELNCVKTIVLVNKSDAPIDFSWKAFSTPAEDQMQRDRLVAQLEAEHAEEELMIGALQLTDDLGGIPEIERIVKSDSNLDDDDDAPGFQRKKAIEEVLLRKYRNIARALYDDPLLFHDEIFSIEPLSGRVWAHSSVSVTIVFRPKASLSYSCMAFCAIDGELDRHALTLRGTGIGPRAAFSFDELDVGNIFVESEHRYEVELLNKGNIPVLFSLKSNNSAFGRCFTFEPSEGEVAVGDSIAITVDFRPDTLGEFSEIFEWRLQGAAVNSTLAIRGISLPPTFTFDCERLNFGLCSQGFLHSKTLSLTNTSEVPLRFNLRIPGDGKFTNREFDIVPSKGTLLPNCTQKIQVDFVPQCPGNLDLSLVVDLAGVGNDMLSLPLQARTAVPVIQVEPRDALDFGEVFARYPFHQTLALHNLSALPARFVVDEQHDNGREVVRWEVDQREGVIPPATSHVLTVTLVAKRPGKLHAPLTIKVEGHPSPLVVNLLGTGVGPRVVVDQQSLDFGRVECLQPVKRELRVTNDSYIDADISALLRTKNSVWSIEPSRFSLKPHETRTVHLTVIADETMLHTESLLFLIKEAPDVIVQLKATGVGSPIFLPRGKNALDLKVKYTTQRTIIEIEVENRGRKERKLTWAPDVEAQRKAERDAMKQKLNSKKQQSLKDASGSDGEGREDLIEGDSPTNNNNNNNKSLSNNNSGSKTGKGTRIRSTAATPSQCPPFSGILSRDERVLASKQPAQVFEVTPSQVTLPPKTSMKFTLTGLSFLPGKMQSFLSLSELVGNERKPKSVASLEVRALFVPALLQLTPSSLNFSYQWSEQQPPYAIEQNLQLINISPLPIKARFISQHPFHINPDHFELAAGESTNADVSFDVAFRADRACSNIRRQLTIHYEGHPFEDQLEVFGEVIFPNLTLSHSALDFGTVLNCTTKTLNLTLSNSFPLPAEFEWYFVDPDDDIAANPPKGLTITELDDNESPGVSPQSPSASLLNTQGSFNNVPSRGARLLKKQQQQQQPHLNAQSSNALTPPTESRSASKVKDLGFSSPVLQSGKPPIPLSDIFDFQPTRGVLQPGETVDVKVSYFGLSDRQVNVTAVCVLRGGPEYILPLSAVAAGLNFSIDKQLIEVGSIPFGSTVDREIFVSNTGALTFPFKADLSKIVNPWVVDCSPQVATVLPGEKLRVIVRCRPGIPERFSETIRFLCGHAEPFEITVVGRGICPSITLSLPRENPAAIEASLDSARKRLLEEYNVSRDERDRRLSIEMKRLELEGDVQSGKNGDSKRSSRPNSADSYNGRTSMAESKFGAESVVDFQTEVLAVSENNQGSGANSLMNDHVDLATVGNLDTERFLAGNGTALQFSADELNCEIDRYNLIEILKEKFEGVMTKLATSTDGFIGSSIQLDAMRSIATGQSKLESTDGFAAAAGGRRASTSNIMNNNISNKPTNINSLNINVGGTVTAAQATANVANLAKSGFTIPAKVSKLFDASTEVTARFVCDLGNLVLGHSKTKTFSVTNCFNEPITLIANRKQILGSEFSLEPEAVRRLPPGESATITVTVQRDKLGKEGSSELDVAFSLEKGAIYSVSFRANHITPSLVASETKVDFGLVPVLYRKSIPLRFFNKKTVPLEWSYKDPVDRFGNKFPREQRPFSIEPQSGILQPGNWQEVWVHFSPHDYSNSPIVTGTEVQKAKPSIGGKKQKHAAPKYESHYASRITIKIKDNPTMFHLPVCGEVEVLRANSLLNDKTLVLPPCLPHSRDVLETLVIENPCTQPIEVVLKGRDEKFVEEVQMIRSFEGYDEYGMLLAPIRKAGDPIEGPWRELVNVVRLKQGLDEISAPDVGDVQLLDADTPPSPVVAAKMELKSLEDQLEAAKVALDKKGASKKQQQQAQSDIDRLTEEITAKNSEIEILQKEEEDQIAKAKAAEEERIRLRIPPPLPAAKMRQIIKIALNAPTGSKAPISRGGLEAATMNKTESNFLILTEEKKLKEKTDDDSLNSKKKPKAKDNVDPTPPVFEEVIEFSQKTRWLIPALSRQEIIVRFSAPGVGVFQDSIEFEVIGGLQPLSIPISASCCLPDVVRDWKSIFFRPVKELPPNAASSRTIPHFFGEKTNTLELGPLLIKRDPNSMSSVASLPAPTPTPSGVSVTTGISPSDSMNNHITNDAQSPSEELPLPNSSDNPSSMKADTTKPIQKSQSSKSFVKKKDGVDELYVDPIELEKENAIKGLLAKEKSAGVLRSHFESFKFENKSEFPVEIRFSLASAALSGDSASGAAGNKATKAPPPPKKGAEVPTTTLNQLESPNDYPVAPLDQYPFRVEPKILTLQPGQTGFGRVWAFPTSVGAFKDTVIGSIHNNCKVIEFDVKCEGTKPSIEPVDASGNVIDLSSIPSPSAATTNTAPASKGAKGKTADVIEEKGSPIGFFDFGKAIINQRLERSISFKNTSSLPLSWKIDGNLPSCFELINNSVLSGRLSPGQFTTIAIAFLSSASVSHDFNLTLKATDVDQQGLDIPPMIIPITAEAFEVQVALSFENPSEPLLPDQIAPSGLEFGDVKVGMETHRIITATNKGKYAATVAFKIKKSARKYLSIESSSAEIPAGQSVSFLARLLPTSPKIIIKSDDVSVVVSDSANNISAIKPDHPPITVSFVSHCAEPIILPARGLSFAALEIGSQVEKVIQIRNEGAFPFEWRLCDYNDLMNGKVDLNPSPSDISPPVVGGISNLDPKAKNGKVKAPAPKANVSAGGKKENAAVVPFTTSLFTVSNSRGVIEPKEIVNVTVTFDAKNEGEVDSKIVVLVEGAPLDNSEVVSLLNRCIEAREKYLTSDEGKNQQLNAATQSKGKTAAPPPVSPSSVNTNATQQQSSHVPTAPALVPIEIYSLQGDVHNPVMSASWEWLFEEQTVFPAITDAVGVLQNAAEVGTYTADDMIGKVFKKEDNNEMILRSTFIIEDRTLFFGPVLADCTASKDNKKKDVPASTNDNQQQIFQSSNGQSERIRLSNPTGIPITINLNLLNAPPVGESKSTAPAKGGAKPPPGKGASTGPEKIVNGCWEIFPSILSIPPHNYAYATLTFKPTAAEKSNIWIEALVANPPPPTSALLQPRRTIQAATRSLNFQAIGVGALPVVSADLEPALEDAPAIAGCGFYFGALAVGKKMESKLTLTSRGKLPASILVKSKKLSGPKGIQVINFPSVITLAPGEVKSYTIEFAPVAAGESVLNIELLTTSNPLDPVKMLTVKGLGVMDPFRWEIPLLPSMESIIAQALGQVSNETPPIRPTVDQVNFGSLVLGGQKQSIVSLINQSDDIMRFEFPHEESHLWPAELTPGTLSIKPSVGLIPPRGSKDVMLNLCPQNPIVLTHLNLPCFAASVQLTKSDDGSNPSPFSVDWDDLHKHSISIPVSEREERMQNEQFELRVLPPPTVYKPSPITNDKSKGAASKSKAPPPAPKKAPPAAKKAAGNGASKTSGKKGEEVVPVEVVEMVKVIMIKPEPKNTIIPGSTTFDMALRISATADIPKCELFVTDGASKAKELSFGSTNFHCKREAFVTVKNDSNSAFPFSLDFHQLLEPSTEIESGSSSIVGSLLKDVGFYIISPRRGVVPANGEVKISVIFAPTELTDYSCALSLKIPGQQMESAIALKAHALRPVVHIDLEKLDLNSNSVDPGSDIDGVPIKVLRFSTVGSQTRTTKQFSVLNTTMAPLNFLWQDSIPPTLLPDENNSNFNARDLSTMHPKGGPVYDQSAFSITPRKGSILPGKRMEFSVEFSAPESLYTYAACSRFFIPSDNVGQTFYFRGMAEEPVLFFDVPKVDFHKLMIGSSTAASFKLVNCESVAYPFLIERMTIESVEGDSTLSVSPLSGVIPPKSSVTIHAIFQPSQERPFNWQMLCKVKRKSRPLQLNIKGEGVAVHQGLLMEDPVNGHERPLQPSTAVSGQSHVNNNEIIDFGFSQIGESRQQRFVLVNYGKYAYDFSWNLSVPSNNQKSSSSNRTVSPPLQSSRSLLPSRFDGPPFVSIMPESGLVEPGRRLPIVLTYHPEVPHSLDNVTAVCKISTSGKQYAVKLSGSASKPKVVFSDSVLDFGPCFLRGVGAESTGSPPPSPNARSLLKALSSRQKEDLVGPEVERDALGFRIDSKELTITNTEKDRPITVRMDTAPPSWLDVHFTPSMILPGESLNIKIGFIPNEPIAYSDRLWFNINDSNPVVVNVSGRGVALQLETASPDQSIVDFGDLTAGQSIVKKVDIINRSARAIEFRLDCPGHQTISLEPNGPLAALMGFSGGRVPRNTPPASGVQDLSLYWTPSKISLGPKERSTVEICYKPNAMMKPFRSRLTAICDAGHKTPILTITGKALAAQVRLSETNISFGNVIVGATAERSVRLQNDGDLGVKYRLEIVPVGFAFTPSHSTTGPSSRFGPSITREQQALIDDFTVEPRSGFISPHEDLELLIKCAPKNPSKSVSGMSFTFRVILEGSASSASTNNNNNSTNGSHNNHHHENCIDALVSASASSLPTTAKEVISFESPSCPTTPSIQTIKLTNPSNKEWILTPQIKTDIPSKSAASFFDFRVAGGVSNSRSVAIPAGGEIALEVLYSPTSMTKLKTSAATAAAESTSKSTTGAGAKPPPAGKGGKGDSTGIAGVPAIDIPDEMDNKLPPLHIGSLFISIPDGSARVFRLEGKSTPPLDKLVEINVTAKTSFTHALSISNWVPNKQRLMVNLSLLDVPSVSPAEMDTIVNSNLITTQCMKVIELPAGVGRNRDLPIVFFSFKSGITARFLLTLSTPSASQQQQQHHASGASSIPQIYRMVLAVKFEEPTFVGVATLKCMSKGTAQWPIHIHNPLPTPLMVECKCELKDVSFTPVPFIIPPSQTQSVLALYKPQEPTPFSNEASSVMKSSILLVTKELGIFPYELEYEARPTEKDKELAAMKQLEQIKGSNAKAGAPTSKSPPPPKK